MDANGNFVVWHSLGQDGSSLGIYASRYNGAGFAQRVEFRVNTTTVNDQALASSAMGTNGDFVTPAVPTDSVQRDLDSSPHWY